jgi:hypothetical protein
MPSSTHVFPDDLLQGVAKNLPGEDLDILLNVAGLRVREAHDDLEELFAVLLGLGNRKRAEAFEVSADSILLLNGKTNPDERFKQVDSIHTCHETLILSFPANAADANAVWRALLRSYRLEISVDGASSLSSGELHETALNNLLIFAPALSHAIQIATELENGLGGVDCIRVE